jgi:hypothetical protein
MILSSKIDMAEASFAVRSAICRAAFPAAPAAFQRLDRRHTHCESNPQNFNPAVKTLLGLDL